jgi:hypothetical protein
MASKRTALRGAYSNELVRSVHEPDDAVNPEAREAAVPAGPQAAVLRRLPRPKLLAVRGLAPAHDLVEGRRTPPNTRSAVPLRSRSFVVCLASAGTSAAGKPEFKARITEVDEAPRELARRDFQLADALLGVVTNLLLEMVREDDGGDGAAILEQEPAGP